MGKACPNYSGCRLVRTSFVIADEEKRQEAVNNWCLDEETWKNCKRYQTRRALWICPDFVLPDSDMTEDEIAERYENETAGESKQRAESSKQ